jgi:hypothetical protein
MLSERSALPHDAAAGSNGAGDALQPPATPAAPNGTAAPGEDDAQLWSSILASVHGSRAAPVRNVVMLGECRASCWPCAVRMLTRPHRRDGHWQVDASCRPGQRQHHERRTLCRCDYAQQQLFYQHERARERRLGDA